MFGPGPTFAFSVAVRDDGGTANSGVDTSPTQNFTLVIDSVNDAPVVPSQQPIALNEDDSTPITGFSVTDADAADDPLLVTLSVGNGQLVFLNPAGVNVTDGDGSDGNLSFTGSQTQASADGVRLSLTSRE